MAKGADIRVKAIRREEPDLRKLARALIQLALAGEAEASLTSDQMPPQQEVAS